MSINKFAVSVALAGILGASSALAETDGAFAGVYMGMRGTKAETEVKSNYSWYNGNASTTSSGMKYGILGGYHQSFSDELGLRYYGAADIGDFTTNISANVDALYSFTKTESVEFRGFGGAWLGYASHDGDVSGLDLGINLGVRAVVAQKHGIEFYGHFGFLSQDKDFSSFAGTSTLKISQPYQIGLRYTFSF